VSKDKWTDVEFITEDTVLAHPFFPSLPSTGNGKNRHPNDVKGDGAPIKLSTNVPCESVSFF
jgi:hypothetical protein